MRSGGLLSEPKGKSAMTEVELLGIIRDVNAQYATLFAQVITINFAMVVAIYYFLHRARLPLRLAAFACYAIGMLSLIGLMLQQANFKQLAIDALEALPPEQLSSVSKGFLLLRHNLLFVGTGLFLNTALWILFAVIAWLLFRWKGEGRGESGSD